MFVCISKVLEKIKLKKVGREKEKKSFMIIIQKEILINFSPTT